LGRETTLPKATCAVVFSVGSSSNAFIQNTHKQTGTTAIRNLVREGKIHQIPGTMQVSQKDGMQTMDMALQSLVTRGIVTKEEAQAKSMNPNLFGPSVVGGAVGGRI